MRRELDKAEEMYRKALELDKALGRKKGKAADYGNLGIVYQTRGDLDKAEERGRVWNQGDEGRCTTATGIVYDKGS
ncbi:hypothetical protein GKODMF_01875 [Candidatus Electrothrix gigas]